MNYGAVVSATISERKQTAKRHDRKSQMQCRSNGTGKSWGDVNFKVTWYRICVNYWWTGGVLCHLVPK